MRRKLGHDNMVRKLVQRNFDVQPMKCPDCGHDLFYCEEKFLVGYVPETVCQQPGGQYTRHKIEHYACASCHKEMNPDEWQKAAREAFENQNKKVLVPDNIKPHDNGEE